MTFTYLILIIFVFAIFLLLFFIEFLQCFAAGAEIGPHKNDHRYQFMVGIQTFSNLICMSIKVV